MIETQLAQIAQQVGSSSSSTGTQSPGQPVVNPREQAKAITLRSGKGYDDPVMVEEGVPNSDGGVPKGKEEEYEAELSPNDQRE